ncbi:MAG: hypothetical protein KUL85_01070 [Sphingobacterium mizutaii]|nr:hypothetical protein [Sphingobacterium mizutaii]
MENDENNFGQPENINQQNNPYQNYDLKIGPVAIEYLRETAKWTKFLSILGMIGMAIYLVVAFFMFLYFIGNSSTSREQVNAFAMIPFLLMMIIMIALYFAPILWLYKFSKNLQEAINLRNSDHLTTAFNFLKKHYKFIGILAIIMVGLYLLSFFGLLATGILSKMAGGGGL